MNLPEIFKLVGIVIVVAGLALKLRTTLVVVTAGLVTGLVSGLPLLSGVGVFEGIPLLTRPGQEGIINILGRAFADNRLMTLFIITLPAIGLAERYGLQEQSARFIRRVSAATVGRFLITYQLFRVLMGILGIRLLGHPAFVRPLVFPMARGAAEAGRPGDEDLPEGEVERIKAASAASENYGNFYGQNLSPVQAGVLLVYGTLGSSAVGYPVSLWSIVFYAIPVATLSVVVAAAQFLLFDRLMRRRLAKAR